MGAYTLTETELQTLSQKAIAAKEKAYCACILSPDIPITMQGRHEARRLTECDQIYRI